MKSALISSLNDTNRDLHEIKELYNEIDNNIQNLQTLTNFYNNFHLSLGDKCREHLTFDFFCVIPDFVASLISDSVTGVAHNSIMFAKRQLEFNVSVSQSTFHSVSEKGNVTKVAENIFNDFWGVFENSKNTNKILIFYTKYSFYIFEFFVYFYWIKLIKSTQTYHYKWRGNLLYDNHVITKSLVVLDYKYNFYENGQSIFPISEKSIEFFNLMEIEKLVPKLTKKEKLKMSKKLFNTLIQIGSCYLILFQNRLVYWLLDHIRTEISYSLKNIAFQLSNKQNSLKLKVSGEGTFARSLSKITGTISTIKLFEEAEIIQQVSKCLPEAEEPDIDKEIMVYLLSFLVLISILIEPLVKRLRDKVMMTVYPEIFELRTQCLRNEIFDNQNEFEFQEDKDLKLAVKALQDKILNEKPIFYKIPILRNFLSYRVCSGCSKENSVNKCESCGCYFCFSCWSFIEACLVCLCEKKKNSADDDKEYGAEKIVDGEYEYWVLFLGFLEDDLT